MPVIPRTVKNWLIEAGSYVGNASFQRPAVAKKLTMKPTGTRACEGCKQPLVDKAHKDLTVCHVCAPDARSRARFKGYGLTEAGYVALLEKQRHRCPICERALASLDSSEVHIDHCHRTGAVRGVLCRRCNTGLALLEDEGTRSRALSYLSSAPARVLV